jgi:hypothetical protein
MTAIAPGPTNLLGPVDQRAHRDRLHAVDDMIRARCVLKTIDVQHHFAHGVYAREMFMPKGTLVSGKIHKFSQVNILSSGDVSVLTENGEMRFKAPATIVAPAGSKRLLYAHEDATWTTIIGTHETDVNKIEDALVVSSEEDYARYLAAQNKPVETV